MSFYSNNMDKHVMYRKGNKTLALLLIIALSVPLNLVSGSAYAADTYRIVGPSPASMAVDGLVVRPLGIAATILGSAIYVVTLPFSALGGNVGEAGDSLVGEPYRMTFRRPLGHFGRAW